jgi:hypothetical protein
MCRASGVYKHPQSSHLSLLSLRFRCLKALSFKKSLPTAMSLDSVVKNDFRLRHELVQKALAQKLHG